MTLNHLKIGQKAKLIGLSQNASFRDRFIELGFTHGEEITVLRRAPFGGLLQVQLRNTHYAIRRQVARFIQVV